MTQRSKPMEERVDPRAHIKEIENRYSGNMVVSQDRAKTQEDTMAELLSGLLEELPSDVGVDEYKDGKFIGYQLDGEGTAATFWSHRWPDGIITFTLTILELKEDGNVTD
jgi:hypothetical protein